MRHRSQAVYVISVAAELAGMHPQTLRIYERRGLVNPARTQGGNRRYSDDDIEVLRRITELASEGMNLEGIRRVMQLEAEVERLRAELAESQARGAPGGERGRSRASAATSCRCARRWPCSASGPGSCATTELAAICGRSCTAGASLPQNVGRRLYRDDHRRRSGRGLNSATRPSPSRHIIAPASKCLRPPRCTPDPPRRGRSRRARRATRRRRRAGGHPGRW